MTKFTANFFAFFLCLFFLFQAEASQTAVYSQVLSPSHRFFLKHPQEKVITAMESQGMNRREFAFFQSIIDNEGEGFIGYHAASGDYRLFQDLIRFVLDEVLHIKIREDFHFLRIPGTEALCFNSARAFLNAFGDQIDDTTPYTRQHILSLNIALFQFYDIPLELTPRYYLHNQSWTTPDYWTLLLDFVEKIGIDSKNFEPIITLGKTHLPQDRGIIIQFFADKLNVNSSINDYLYLAHSGGKPMKHASFSELVNNPSVLEFPQLRLIIDNTAILNPYSSLKMIRYDSFTEQQRQKYEKVMRQEIQQLQVDQNKCNEVRDLLLKIWCK